MKFTIQGRLDGLNDYIDANRSNRFKGAEMKRRNEELVMLSVRKVKINRPVKIAFKWYEKNSRRDMDNIAFAKKFILDALVKKGVLQDDGWKWVKGFTDEFFIDKQNPRVEVEMEEV